MAGLKMPLFNNVQFAARLTKDPDLRYTSQGKPFLILRTAINSSYKPKDSEESKESTTFVTVTLWYQAEAMAIRLKKGNPVLVEGSLRENKWVDEGEKRTSLGVSAHKVHVLEWETTYQRNTGVPADQREGPDEPDDSPFDVIQP